MITDILFWLSWIPITIGVGFHIYKLTVPYLTTRDAFEGIKEMLNGPALLHCLVPLLYTSEAMTKRLALVILESLPNNPTIEQICERIWPLTFGGQEIKISKKITTVFAFATSIKYRILIFPSVWIIIGVIMQTLWGLALLLIVIKISIYVISERPKILYFCRSVTKLIAEDIQELIRTKGLQKEAISAVRNWFREAKVPDDAISFIDIDSSAISDQFCSWYVWVSYNLHMSGDVLYKFTLNHDFSIDKVETSIDTPVYITTSGEKYHLADCYHLKDGATPITKQEAIAEGYTPCSVCKA